MKNYGTAYGPVYFPESPEDLSAFRVYLRNIGSAPLAVDTETTGLDLYSPGHALRLIQFGTANAAWVLRLDVPEFRAEAVRVLREERYLVCHNAAYDLQVIDHHLGVTLEELTPRTFDTRILAHLLDPRGKADGGIGHGLKDLATVYVDADAPDADKALTAVFRSLKATKETGWSVIPTDHPDYVKYAGVDVLLTSRLFAEIAPMVKEIGLNGLSNFEHHLQGLLAILQRRGMRIDVPYTTALKSRLLEDADAARLVAARYGVENVNSTAQVAASLAAMGETLTERTPAGAVKVDKAVLLPLADLDLFWQRLDVRTPNPLAEAVLHAKRAEKWAVTYAQALLDLRDSGDRVHPSINSLQARTARMSVSRPPLQQLPSGDWQVRRCFVADPGTLIVAADYSQVEMRVLAALSKDATMIEAIQSGTDLHDFTAARVFGPDFTKAQRKIAKAVGFGKVYGGGATTIQRQTGADLDAIKDAIAAYDQTYPGIREYSRKLQRRAEYGAKEVVTPAGRHLPLDKDRLYAATNYVVQSTARDLLAQAIVDLFQAGLGDYLLLPVHDEVIAQAPAADAAEVVAEIGRVMESDFYGVRITSDAEVYGPSWGHGYGATE